MEKTRYDERQEYELLRMDRVGCSIAWYGLLLAILIQWIVYGGDLPRLLGEIAVFVPLTVYLAVSGFSKGLRDRYWPASIRSKALVSLLFGLAAAGLNEISTLLHPARAWGGHAKMILLLLGAVSVFSFFALILFQHLLDRKQRSLEKENDEE